MANAGRTTTQLDIKVNARELNRLDAKLRNTFKSATTRDFNKQLAGLSKLVEKTVGSFDKLNRTIVGGKKGIQTYKALANQIARARQEAERLQRTLGKMAQSGMRQPSSMPGAGGQFTVGGAYIPGSGGGQGGGYGGGGQSPTNYRGRTNVATNAQTGAQMGLPSMQMYGQMFSGIPFVGGAIAGMFGMQSSFYQAHMQRRKAQYDTYALLGGRNAAPFRSRLGLDEYADVPMAKVSESAVQAGVSKAQQEAVGKVDVGGLSNRGRKMVSPAIPGKPRHVYMVSEYRKDRRNWWQRNMPNFIGGKDDTSGWGGTIKVDPAVAPVPAKYEGADVTDSELEKSFGRIKDPKVKRALKEKLNSGASKEELQAEVQRLAKAGQIGKSAAEVRAALQSEAARKRRRAVFQQQRGTSDLNKVGLEFGYAEPQALQRANQFASALGSRPDAKSYRFAEAMRAGFGTDLQTTGGLMKGLSSTTGNEFSDPRQAVTKVFANALAAGLDGSEAVTYLKEIAGLTQAQYDLGVRSANTEGLRQNMRFLSRAGISGRAASKTTMGFMKGAGEVGYGGPQSNNAHHFALMRAAGYDPSQGAEGFFRAQEELQMLGAGTGSTKNNVMVDYLRQHLPPGSENTATARHFIQSAYKGVGTRISRDQAGQIFDALNAGATGTGEAGAGEVAVTIQDIIKQGRRATGRGSMSAEASLTNRRAGVGAVTAGEFRRTQSALLKFAKVAAPAINKVASGLNTVMLEAAKGAQALTTSIEKLIKKIDKMLD